MKLQPGVRKTRQVVGLKTQTNLKAGECCWGAYRDAYASNRREDWDRFYDCCRRDGDCSY